MCSPVPRLPLEADLKAVDFSQRLLFPRASVWGAWVSSPCRLEVYSGLSAFFLSHLFQLLKVGTLERQIKTFLYGPPILLKSSQKNKTPRKPQDMIYTKSKARQGLGVLLSCS